MDAWYEIYQSYTAEEIAADITRLKEALQNLNTSQTHGTLSWQRSRDGLVSQLQMATRVYKEKTGQPPVQNHALVDMGGTTMNNGDRRDPSNDPYYL